MRAKACNGLPSPWGKNTCSSTDIGVAQLTAALLAYSVASSRFFLSLWALLLDSSSYPVE